MFPNIRHFKASKESIVLCLLDIYDFVYSSFIPYAPCFLLISFCSSEEFSLGYIRSEFFFAFHTLNIPLSVGLHNFWCNIYNPSNCWFSVRNVSFFSLLSRFFYLSLIFRNLITMCMSFYLLRFILFGVCWRLGMMKTGRFLRKRPNVLEF